MNDQFTEMLGVLAHEMRTPIAAILGYQELLAEGIFGDIDPRGQEPLSRIAYSAKQLLHLIDGVQEVASPPEKRLEMQTQTFDPQPILQQCLHNAAMDAHGRSVGLEESVDAELPHVVGDPNRFGRAIDLALAAAIKTSHGSTLQVSARCVHESVEIAIAGTGLEPGRDDPPSFRSEEPRASPLTGAGLRLSIVRHLAEQMRGEVSLHSSEGSTTILLQLPGS